MIHCWPCAEYASPCNETCLVWVILEAFLPFWPQRAALDRSQDGRWKLVCRVWIPAEFLRRQTQTTGWRKMLPWRGWWVFIVSLCVNFSFLMQYRFIPGVFTYCFLFASIHKSFLLYFNGNSDPGEIKILLTHLQFFLNYALVNKLLEFPRC